MELTRFREFSPDVYREYPLDEWSSSLRSVCGNFQPKPCDGVRRVTGRVHPSTAGGIEFVQVANDLAIIQRDLHDIRKDYGEHLFLLLQIEGECGIEQYGRQTIVAPGDCVLVDSSSPSTFHFGGKFSNHLSVHLPRQIFFSDRSTRVDVSRRVEADDPMSSILRGLVAKLMKTDSGDKRAPELRQLLFSATRQAFASDDCDDLTLQSDCAYHRIEIVQISHRPSPDREETHAAMAGQPRRRFFADFAGRLQRARHHGQLPYPHAPPLLRTRPAQPRSQRY